MILKEKKEKYLEILGKMVFIDTHAKTSQITFAYAFVSEHSKHFFHF